MSRHVITDGPFEIAVGWDPPLQTFFGQVYDHRITDPDRQLVLWVGADERLPRVADLHRALSPSHSWVVDAHWGYLHMDQDADV